jgi:hypothetical protein
MAEYSIAIGRTAPKELEKLDSGVVNRQGGWRLAPYPPYELLSLVAG